MWLFMNEMVVVRPTEVSNPTVQALLIRITISCASMEAP